jgi:outer membrane protein
MTKRIGRIFLAFVFGCLLIHPSHAAESEALQLTIQDAIAIVLTHNLGLKLERITPEIKRENLEGAGSVFDPVVSLEGAHSRLETADGDPADVESTESSLEAGVEKMYPYGTRLALSMILQEDLKKAPTTTITSINPYTTATNSTTSSNTYLKTVLALTQPLMKNRGSDVNERQILIAENDYKKAELAFEQTVIDTIAQTKRLYWQLFSAKEQLQVQEKSLLLAKQFLNEVEEKVKVGSAAVLEILEAKAEVASREDALIRAEYDLMNSQDNLLTYIYGRLEETRSVECIQKPEIEERVIHEAELLQKALSLRSNYQSIQYDIDSAEIDSVYWENQKKAQLDLIGSVGYNKALTEEAKGDLSYQDYYTGEIKLSLQFPWGFRQDSANYRAAMKTLSRSKLQRDTIETQIRLELRTAVRSVTSAHKRYQSAALAAQLAEEKLAAEQEKYKSGLSTSYNVLLYQRDWINAMVNRVDAVINYQLAIVYLNAAAGITLEQNGISIKELL